MVTSENEVQDNFTGVLVIASSGRVNSNVVCDHKSHGICCMKNSQLTAEDNVVCRNAKVGLICRDTSRVSLFENNFAQNSIALLIESKDAVDNQDIESKVILGEARYYKPKGCRIF